jgi:hypothetical protein
MNEKYVIKMILVKGGNKIFRVTLIGGSERVKKQTFDIGPLGNAIKILLKLKRT